MEKNFQESNLCGWCSACVMALSPTEVSPIQREAVDRSIYSLKFILLILLDDYDDKNQ